MNKKINIEDNSKVRIIWNVLLNDYTKEKENNIIAKFAAKYNIPKSNIKVEPVLVTYDKDGNKTALTSEITHNIHDPNFQKGLFKKYLAENNITNYDFDYISSIDDQINSYINYDLYERYRRYDIKWVRWSNFMSYGDNNFFDFTDLKGLVLLNGIPENQSGKSTFCNDLIKFLLFGRVSDRDKDWTLADTFNYYKPEATEMYVEGCFSINGEDYIINRTITRPELKRRTAKSKVTQKVSYYKLINNEKIKLEDIDSDNQEGASNTQTNKIIKESIGNEKDFDLIICANSDNLKSLISLKDTERGRLLSRWIGLLPLEEKDKIAREKFNKEISPKLLLNQYDRETLKAENTSLLEEICEANKDLSEQTKLKDDVLSRIQSYEEEKVNLLLSKKEIDNSILNIDVNTVETELKTLEVKFNHKLQEKNKNIKDLEEIKNVFFNEVDYKNKINEDKKLSILVATKRSDCKRIKDEIKTLKQSEFCPTCGAKLQNIDNSSKINEKENEFKQLVSEGITLNEKLKNIKAEIENLESKREIFNKKVKLELIIDTNTVDIENINNKISQNKQLLSSLNKNKDIIENNNKIDLSLNIVNQNILNENKCKTIILAKIDDINRKINSNNLLIDKNNSLIKRIEEDEYVFKNWRIYLDLVGKNGISKMVLRNALPLINGELKRLLNEVCDFDVEVEMDNNNDISFYLIRNGIKSGLGSGSGFEQTCAGLALRVILGNISTLPRPNYIILDEILGGVSEENYDKIKLLYNRIKENYSFIFQITHLKSITDWHDSIITVEKNNNISKIL